MAWHQMDDKPLPDPMLTNFHHAIMPYGLTHWGRVTHICVGNLTIIGSDNGLAPGRRQAIIGTNAGIVLTGPLRTKLQGNFNQNSYNFIQENVPENAVCKMAAILSRSQCVDELNHNWPNTNFQHNSSGHRHILNIHVHCQNSLSQKIKKKHWNKSVSSPWHFSTTLFPWLLATLKETWLCDIDVHTERKKKQAYQ